MFLFCPKKEEDFQKDRPSVIQVNHGTSLRNPVDPHINETKKYSRLSKKVKNFQKDRSSVIQEIRGASLCNPVDLHVYETKKPALKSAEAAIILKTAHETSISRFKLCKNTISSYPAADSSSCGPFVVKHAQDYANGISYLGSALSFDLPSTSKYKRSKGRSTVSNQKVIDLYNDDTEMANMKTVELMNKYRNELDVQNDEGESLDDESEDEAMDDEPEEGEEDYATDKEDEEKGK
ncbi:nucleomorphin-like [Artemia franciscana]|uniref:nucleomorphin-like n=1 Tax=Artemia franciscana TaxID=6661 RepID=UPI0032DA90EB